MAYAKVTPANLNFVRQAPCANDGTKIIEFNKGLPLPCREYTNIESALLRRRAIMNTQLMMSGLVRMVDRSAIGDDLRILQYRPVIGEIKTEDADGRGLRDCKRTYEGVGLDKFEKKFYVVNTSKHLEICPRDLIGTTWQSAVGNNLNDYKPENFEDTTLADILIAQILDEYNNEFAEDFMVNGVWGTEGKNKHGDDGYLAKAYYASKNRFFAAKEFDFSGTTTQQTIHVIQGGKKNSWTLTDTGADLEAKLQALLAEIVDWVNDLKDGRRAMYSASFNPTDKTVVVTSNFATEKVTIRFLVNDGMPVDWGVKCTMEEELQPTLLQNNMLINDSPLLFKYEEINEQNFTELFKKYVKEFMRYLKRNGFNMMDYSDFLIAIDPELLLEREDASSNRFLKGGIPIDFMEQLGLGADKFVGINALMDTGLFFITIPGNLWVLSDEEGIEGGGLDRISIEKCEDLVRIVFDVPLGTDIEHYGLFASNLCDSWFVENYELDNRAPYKNTRNSLYCFDDQNRNNCITGPALCKITASVEASAVYDGGADETTVTVDITAFVESGYTVNHNISYQLSDGTAMTGITTPSFSFVLPGDQSENLSITINDNMEAVDGSAQTGCTEYLQQTIQIGQGGPVGDCTFTGDALAVVYGDSIELAYTTSKGVDDTIPFIDTALNLDTPADWDAIATEIEAILPGTDATIVDNGGGKALVTISDVNQYYEGLTLNTAAGNLSLTQDC